MPPGPPAMMIASFSTWTVPGSFASGSSSRAFQPSGSLLTGFWASAGGVTFCGWSAAGDEQASVETARSAAANVDFMCRPSRDSLATTCPADGSPAIRTISVRCDLAVARLRKTRTLLGEDFAGVENPERIEGPLHGLHDRDRRGVQLQVQILGLGEADAVLAADRALERHHPFEQDALRLVGAAHLVVVARRHHDVDVDVAVAGVPETGDAEAEVAFEPLDEGEQLRDPPLGHDHVMVELDRRDRLQRRRQLAPHAPDFLAFG